MEFKAIESSRVVALTIATRHKGQVFLPDAIDALRNRYRFQSVPSVAEYQADILSFKIGIFDGVQINEFSVYNDGVIVEAKTDTALLVRFLDDLLAFVDREMGIKETGLPPNERHYESQLIVSMDINPKKALPVTAAIQGVLSDKQEEYGLRRFAFDFAAFSLAVDVTAYAGRRPVPFTLARRVNVPFESNVYFSSAPLKTDEHLALLNAIEDRLR